MESREEILYKHVEWIFASDKEKESFLNAMQEYSDQQNKQLIDEIDKLKSKVSNWMDKYTEVNEENKQLKASKSEEIEAVDALLNTFGQYCTLNGIKLTDSNKVGQAVIDFLKSIELYNQK